MSIQSIDNQANSNSFPKIALGAVTGGALVGLGGYFCAATDTMNLKPLIKDTYVNPKAITEDFANCMRQGISDIDDVLVDLKKTKERELVPFLKNHKEKLVPEDMSVKVVSSYLEKIGVKTLKQFKLYLKDVKLGGEFIATGLKTISKWQPERLELTSVADDLVKNYKMRSALKFGAVGFVAGGLITFFDEVFRKSDRVARDCFLD